MVLHSARLVIIILACHSDARYEEVRALLLLVSQSGHFYLMLDTAQYNDLTPCLSNTNAEADNKGQVHGAVMGDLTEVSLEKGAPACMKQPHEMLFVLFADANPGWMPTQQLWSV